VVVTTGGIKELRAEKGAANVSVEVGDGTGIA
jgi:hypothetical protein